MHWASALAAAIGCACVGALAQWCYARLGWDLETLLLARMRPAVVTPPLSRMLVTALLLGSVGTVASAGVLQLVLRLFGVAARPFPITFRVVAFSALGTLAKLIPLVGYFVALGATLALLVVGVRRVHGIATRRAVLAVVCSTLLTLALVIPVAATVARISR